MFVLGNVLLGLGVVLDNLLVLYGIVLIGAVIVSWVNADPRNPIVRFLYMATEPALRRIRRWLPASLRYFPIDIAFIVLGALVLFARFAVALSLIEMGHRLKIPTVL